METTEDKKCCETKKCGCCCHKMPGVGVVLVGIAVLLRVLDVLGHKGFWITIAVLIILGGLKWMTCGMCKCCDKA